MSRKLATGIDPLDDELDGGVAGGRILALSAPPASPSELLLHEIAAQRKTLYLTTTRNCETVRRTLRNDGFDMQSRKRDVWVEDVDAVDVETESLMNGCVDCIEKFENAMRSQIGVGDFNIIIDTADILEHQNYGWVLKFFDKLRNRLVNTEEDVEGLVVLHLTRGEHVPDQRDLTLTLADVVAELHRDIEGEDMSYRLFMPKNRGSTALMEGLKLNLTNEVMVDTSRDIS